MLCKFPQSFDYRNKDVAYPCGQCMTCRINKRRIWAHRIMLETLAHKRNSFLTITYADKFLPENNSVSVSVHQQFIKNLRYHFGEKYPSDRIRFYGVGEYGEKTMRPHYHYALFGFPECEEGPPDRSGHFIPCRCRVCSIVNVAWGQGHIFNGYLSVDAAQYVAGYIEKKLTSDKSEFQQKVLQGRYPEFSRMSRMPGIGAFQAERISKALTTYGLLEKADVPRSLVHGSKVLPLGRYLSDKIYAHMGHTYEEGERQKSFESSLRSMLLSREDISSIAPYYKGSVASALKFLGSQRILDLETKKRLTRKDKKL